MADGPEKQKALRAARKIPLLCEQPVEALEEALENVVHAVSEEGRGAPLLMWQGCPGACRPHPKGHLATYAVAPLAVPEDIFVSREARQAPCREADKRGNAMGGQEISPMMWYDEIEPGTEPERSMSWEGTAPVFLETQAVDMLKVLNVEHPDYNHCKPYLQSSRESN